MRALQALVIGMGILIVLGLILLVFGMYKKTTDPTWRLFGNQEQQQASPIPKPAGHFGTIPLNLPDGHRIDAITSDGLRLFVTVRSDATTYIVVLDAGNGDELGRIQAQ